MVLSKLSWIQQQQAILAYQQKDPIRCSYSEGEQHAFNGQSYPLRIVEAHQKPSVEFDQRHITLHVRPNTTRDQRVTLLNQWYRYQLKQSIPHLIQRYEPLMKVKVKAFGVKRMKTKWGSCNITAQRLWFNLELAKKPPKCLEYVVVHEMVHLLETHHTQRFKSLMDTFLPQWRLYDQELY